MSDTPTCPLSDEDFEAVSLRYDESSQSIDLMPLALAVVAAERARLREAFNERIGEACLFDELCASVDATTRRADP